MSATRRLAFAAAVSTLLASSAWAQTNTPTNTATPTSTPTFTASRTPTITPTWQPSPAQPSLELRVPAGATTSNMLRLNAGQVYTVTIMAPATLAETVVFEVADSADSPTWRAFQFPNGTDAAVVAAKAITLPDVGAALLRAKLNGNAAALRTFTILSVRKAG